MIKKKDLSKEDIKIWESYTRNPSDIYDKEIINSGLETKKGRYKFDLHGHTLDAANRKVKEVILLCIKNKYKELLLITGKGLHSNSDSDIYASKNLSKLKYSVPEFIKSDFELSKLIISINDAEKKDGGEGAILIKLRNL